MLEDLSGKPVGKLYGQYQISQNQYWQWPDKFLAEPHRAFEGKVNGSELSRLKAKNQRSRQIIGALTVSPKKRVRVVNRRPSESVVVRNKAILPRLRELKSDHPFWVYRRCWVHLQYVVRLEVDKKRVLRLLKGHGL